MESKKVTSAQRRKAGQRSNIYNKVFGKKRKFRGNQHQTVTKPSSTSIDNSSADTAFVSAFSKKIKPNLTASGANKHANDAVSSQSTPV